MSFLYPTYLYGLGLVLIPVIIHYFNFQRARRVYFTNVAFLQSVQKETNSRNRLRHLLVMLLRMLFIACLVLAFARPYQQEGNLPDTNLKSSQFVSVYLDNSYSAQQEINGEAALELMRGTLLKIPETYPQNALFSLLDNRFDVRSRFFYDGTKFSDQATEITFSNSARDLNSVLSRQASALRMNAPVSGNHIYWLSDFQKVTAGDISGIQLDTLNQYFFLPFSSSGKDNLFIDSVWINAPFIRPEQNNTLNARVQNNGSEKFENLSVKLMLEGEQVSVANLTIEPNSEEVISMGFSVQERGLKKGSVILEDYPVIFDDEYYFVLQAAPLIHISSISESKSDYVKKVYGVEEYFKLNQYSTESIDFNALKYADLVILENLNEIDAALGSALNEVWMNGGSVAYFPGQKASNEELSSFFGVQIQSLASADRENKIGLNPPSPRQPFFEDVFEKIDPNMNMPVSSPIISWRNVGEEILSHKSGQPFFNKLRIGNGQLFLFSTPLEDAFTNLPRHALFVPIMLRMAVSSKQVSAKLAYEFGDEQVRVTLDSIGKGEVFKLVSKELEMIPQQRVLGTDLIISIPSGEWEAGIYQLKSTADDRVAGNLAFNYDQQESDLQAFSSEELTEIFKGYPNVKVLEDISPENFVSVLKEEQSGQEWWRLFLILALIFLLLEVLLIRFSDTRQKKKAVY